MRIDPPQPISSMRTTVLLSACLALVATTSGLLLAIHIHYANHSHNHNSQDCAVCQQLLATSKKPTLMPDGERVQEAPALCTAAPEFIEHVEHRLPQVARPRGPPRSFGHQSV